MPPKRTKRDGSKWFYSTPKVDKEKKAATADKAANNKASTDAEGNPAAAAPAIIEDGTQLPGKKPHKRGKRGKRGGKGGENELAPVLSAFGGQGQPTNVLREIARKVIGDDDRSVLTGGNNTASSLRVVDKSQRLSLQALPERHVDLNVAPSNWLLDDPLFGVHRLAPGFQPDRTAMATSLLTSAVSELQLEVDGSVRTRLPAALPAPTATVESSGDKNSTTTLTQPSILSDADPEVVAGSSPSAPAGGALVTTTTAGDSAVTGHRTAGGSKILNFATSDTALRKIFKASYQEEEDVFLSVHKVGPTLVIQDTAQGLEGESTVMGARNKSLLSKLLYYGAQQQQQATGSMPPGTPGHRRVNSSPFVTPTLGPSNTSHGEFPPPPISPLSGGTGGFDNNDGALTLPTSSMPLHSEGVNAAAHPGKFNTVLRWGLNDLDVLLGSDIPIVYDQKLRGELVLRVKAAATPLATPQNLDGSMSQTPQFPTDPSSTTATPPNASLDPTNLGGLGSANPTNDDIGTNNNHGGAIELTRTEALESWFDAMLTNVRNVAVCVHHNGVVQDYRIIPANDVLNVIDKLEAAKALNFTSSVLQWLQSECTEEGQSYVLMRQAETGTLKLFQYDPFAAGATKGPGAPSSSSSQTNLQPAIKAIAAGPSHHQDQPASSTSSPPVTPPLVPSPTTALVPMKASPVSAAPGKAVSRPKLSPLRPEVFDTYEGLLLLRMACLSHRSSPPEQIVDWCERGLGLLFSIPERDFSKEREQISRALEMLPALLLAPANTYTPAGTAGSSDQINVVLGSVLKDLNELYPGCLSLLHQPAVLPETGFTKNDDDIEKGQKPKTSPPPPPATSPEETQALRFVWAVERMNNIFSLIRATVDQQHRAAAAAASPFGTSMSAIQTSEQPIGGGLEGLLTEAAAHFFTLLVGTIQHYDQTLPVHARVAILFASLNAVNLLSSPSCLELIEQDDPTPGKTMFSALKLCLQELLADFLILGIHFATIKLPDPALVPGGYVPSTIDLLRVVSSKISHFSQSSNSSGVAGTSAAATTNLFADFTKILNSCKSADDCVYRGLNVLTALEPLSEKAVTTTTTTAGGGAMVVGRSSAENSNNSGEIGGGRRLYEKQAMIYHLVGDLRSAENRPSKALEAFSKAMALQEKAASPSVTHTVTFGSAIEIPYFQPILTAQCMSAVHHMQARLMMETQEASFMFPLSPATATATSVPANRTPSAKKTGVLLPKEEDEWLKAIAIQDKIQEEMLFEGTSESEGQRGGRRKVGINDNSKSSTLGVSLPPKHPVRTAAALTLFDAKFHYGIRLSDELNAGRGTKKHSVEQLASHLVGVFENLLQHIDKYRLGDGRAALVKLELLRVRKKLPVVVAAAQASTTTQPKKSKVGKGTTGKDRNNKKEDDEGSKDPLRAPNSSSRAEEELVWLEGLADKLLAPFSSSTPSRDGGIADLIGIRQALLAANFLFLLISTGDDLPSLSLKKRALICGLRFLQNAGQSYDTNRSGSAGGSDGVEGGAESSETTTPTTASLLSSTHHLSSAILGKIHNELLTQARLLTFHVIKDQSTDFSLAEKDAWRSFLKQLLELERGDVVGLAKFIRTFVKKEFKG